MCLLVLASAYGVPAIMVSARKATTAVGDAIYIEAISDIEAQVASAPRKATIKPYIMVTPPPFTNAVTKNLSRA